MRDGAFNLTFLASRPLFLLCQLRLEGHGQLATVRAHFLTIFLFSSPFLSLPPPPSPSSTAFLGDLDFKLEQLPVSAGAWVGFEQTGGFAAAEGGPG